MAFASEDLTEVRRNGVADFAFKRAQELHRESSEINPLGTSMRNCILASKLFGDQSQTSPHQALCMACRTSHGVVRQKIFILI